jgi:hypothetical protein
MPLKVGETFSSRGIEPIKKYLNQNKTTLVQQQLKQNSIKKNTEEIQQIILKKSQLGNIVDIKA